MTLEDNVQLIKHDDEKRNVGQREKREEHHIQCDPSVPSENRRHNLCRHTDQTTSGHVVEEV